ncbi:PRC-barrel domain-containing protein [Paraburkholderia sp. CNPSo 3272]|uniref:PRC-barrel domain-containing protein n=1 Tax=Paraburkholderia sp. CNPSo 3272 TaxID=2940931 RepID=UPI0020B8DC7D|nr:PRC-barrel domain-containing protein [Paraburkholderia sp. CNPSo 3272]MCP3721918.1 PRC-barrel domain-containing protein [Paraburkholderia sp. CNPSo 3272]
MRRGFLRSTRPVFHFPYALTLLMLLTLSGCSLFRPAPPPEPEAPMATEPEPAASEPEAASAPEAASEPETESTTRPAPKKPRPAPVHRRRPAPPPPAPASAPPAPPPAPIVQVRTLERGTFRTLLDSEVQKTDGKVVGRAVDMVTGPGGKPVDVVVNLQGFMGIGDRKANFPWSGVRVNTQAKTPAITLALPANQLQVPDRPKAGAPQPGNPEASATRLPMLDADVERANGGKVGRVVDVLLDGSAAPQAVVLDVSGTLEKRHTIAADWSALRFVTKNNTLEAQLEMSDQQVDASPPYAPDQPVHAVAPAAPPPAPAAPAASATSAASAAQAAPAASPVASAANAHGAK